MILLSQQGMAASQITDLLGYVPSTVRRGIHRYQRHGASGLTDWPAS
jgi:transposase